MKKFLSTILFVSFLLSSSSLFSASSVQAQGSGSDCTGVRSGLEGECRLIIGESCTGTRDGDCNLLNSCCVECGAESQDCCPDPLSQCNNGYYCEDGQCTTQTENGGSCVGENSGLDGVCVAAGVLGQCDGTKDTAANCRSGACCVECGGLGQPCCESPLDSCSERYLDCDSATHLCTSTRYQEGNAVYCSDDCIQTTINCYEGYRVPTRCVGIGEPLECCQKLGDTSSTPYQCSLDGYACEYVGVPTSTPTPVPGCETCGEWRDIGCGRSGCAEDFRTFIREDCPPGCETRECREDGICSTPTCRELGYGDDETVYTCDSLTGEYCANNFRGIPVDGCLTTSEFVGNCCYPPEQPVNTCTSQVGTICTEECAWPYQPWPSGNCFDDEVCCRAVSYTSCANEIPPGECREVCEANERAIIGDNDCQNPEEYPHDPDPWDCCIPLAINTGETDPTCSLRIGGVSYQGIDTAMGCLPVGCSAGDDDCSVLQIITTFLLRWGLSVAGGIALLLIVYGGFVVIMSQGNPQRVQAGKELITAALSGLLLIIFSATILKLIGVDILGIPGFGN